MEKWQKRLAKMGFRQVSESEMRLGLVSIVREGNRYRYEVSPYRRNGTQIVSNGCISEWQKQLAPVVREVFFSERISLYTDKRFVLQVRCERDIVSFSVLIGEESKPIPSHCHSMVMEAVYNRDIETERILIDALKEEGIVPM